MDSNTKEAILAATSELLKKMVESNGVTQDQVACITFTTTPDLNAEFPALAARRDGWIDTALLCGHEIDVPGSLRSCLRILMLVNTNKGPRDMVHVYIRGAKDLRSNNK